MKMNVEKLLLEIKKHANIISESEKFVRETKQNIAEFLCPFKVGERVLDNDGVAVIINSVSFCTYGKLNYEFDIKKLKKDGTPYIYKSYAYGIGDYKKLPF